MENRLEQMSSSLELSIVDPKLQDLSIDILEQPLDALCQNEAVKDIPIINVCVGIVKTYYNFTDWRLSRKIIAFLSNLGEIDIEKRQEMVNKIYEDPKYKVKVGDRLLSILDKCDDKIKAICVAQLFAAYIEKKISYDDFLRTSFAVNSISLIDLQEFLAIDDKQDLDEIDCHIYAHAGLIARYDINEIKKIEESPRDLYHVGQLYNKYTHVGRLVKDILNIA